MENKLVEKVLCERYNEKYKKNCNCDISLNEGLLELLGMGLVGAKTIAELPKSMYDLLFSQLPKPEQGEKPVTAETRTIPQLRDPNEVGARIPRMTKVKEYGSAEGSVISPS